MDTNGYIFYSICFRNLTSSWKLVFGFSHVKLAVSCWCTMSAYRNAKKIAKGALPDEEADSDDDLNSENEEVSADEGQDSEEEEDSDQEEGEDDSVDRVKAGLKWVKPGRAGAGDAGSDGSDDEDAEEEEEEDPNREIAFPAQCSLCNKTLFNMEQMNDHLTSKGHDKKQKQYDQSRIKFFRTSDQVAKLKARNQRKKDKKMAKKKEVQQAQKANGHVWGEHKKPPKSMEQRAAEAQPKKIDPPKPKDTRTRAEKRASAKPKPSAKKSHMGGGGRGRPGDKADMSALPKQQGKRKNRERD